MTSREYTCQLCGETFHTAWTDEQALAEYRRNFPGESEAEPLSVLCTTCYDLLIAGLPFAARKYDQ